MSSPERAAIRDALSRYWGFDKLRPLQAEAIESRLAGRDSLVVLPTGGGKSLCYQIPPLITGGTDVVVSPLIALMKDQVDSLRAAGYPAAALHSGVEAGERQAAERALLEGELRLLFVAPERLVQPGFMALLERTGVGAFAVDEAHCISQWGHDFRPEYRQLASLRRRFPEASLHAFTATATPRVREDIHSQLALRDARELIGVFDRPNLVYRVLPREDRRAQVLEVLQRHPQEAAIVYCLSRNDTERVAQWLSARGVSAGAYHAGLDTAERKRVQEAFASETLDVVVATVAFGMGIDRSNVRCVVHATMPKSLEHYQQESGRAGRDGLAAECVLLYSPADVMRWRSLLARGANDVSGDPQTALAAQEELLRNMQAFCNRPHCRHRALSEYFGQSYAQASCDACDVCLDEVQGMEDATVAAQKILSCVARTGQVFGLGHITDVLLGSRNERVRQLHHDELTTFGLMDDTPRKTLTSMIYQLVDQEVLERTPGDRPSLRLNDASWEVMRGQREVQIMRPPRSTRRARVEQDSWEGVDRDLAERLRELRRQMAAERGVPPYVIFDDRTLRALARERPRTTAELRAVRGMGEKRVADLGESLIATMRSGSDSSDEGPHTR